MHERSCGRVACVCPQALAQAWEALQGPSQFGNVRSQMQLVVLALLARDAERGGGGGGPAVRALLLPALRDFTQKRYQVCRAPSRLRGVLAGGALL